MRTLDRTDLKILDVLQRDGRLSMTELAELVSLSATPCSERVKRMEREGVVSSANHVGKREVLARDIDDRER